MFTILGIDPGNNTGLAIIRIDENTLEIQDVKTLTLLLGNLIPTDVNNYYLRRKLTLISYLDNINKDFGIDVAGLETAFVNTKFPKSAITLSDYISCIELKLYDISPRIKLYKFPPKSVKALVGATGDATKEDMFNNIQKIKELQPYLHIEDMTEHSIDALSIGYITLQEIRKDPYYLCSI